MVVLLHHIESMLSTVEHCVINGSAGVGREHVFKLYDHLRSMSSHIAHMSGKLEKVADNADAVADRLGGMT